MFGGNLLIESVETGPGVPWWQLAGSRADLLPSPCARHEDEEEEEEDEEDEESDQELQVAEDGGVQSDEQRGDGGTPD